MAWHMIGEPKTRKLTKSLADEFSGMTPAPHDRALNSTRANVVRVAFEQGKFRTCEWASAYCEQTKQKYRINGKHTSTVLSSMNGMFPKDVSIILEHYHCDTLEDVAALYSTFDTRSSVRSAGDINRIYAAICPELDNISGRVISVCVTGIAFSLLEDSYRHRSAEERAQLIVGNVEFILWVAGIVPQKNNSIGHIFRGPVVAAMLKTWNKSKNAATEFWTAVRDETGSKPDSADRKLAKFLITSRLQPRGGTEFKSASGRETYVKCLHAWNAWRKGEPTSLAYHANSKIPAAQ